MAAVSCLLSEDEFVCSICLNVFMDPVSTPCGHNFCQTCISDYWDKTNQCVCPLCKEAFSIRPQVKINKLLSSMVSQLQNKPQDQTKTNVCSEEQAADPQVSCDVCSGTKLKALKSCLVCLVSYCEPHLQPHLTVSALKSHQLISPVKNLEDRMCKKHSKPLDLFCKTDLTFVCMHCTYADHKNHDTVLMHEECEVRKAEVRQMMQERRQKIETIQSSTDLSQKAADKETAAGVQVFSALSESVQNNLDQFKKEIEEKLKKKEKLDLDLIKDLEKEITELEERSTEMEEPAYSEDHLHFLQRFTSMKSNLSMRDWTGVKSDQTVFEGTVMKALLQLDKTLNEALKNSYETDLKMKQKCAVNLTLDPHTAHPNLVLSHGMKQVRYCNMMKDVPNNVPKDNAKRFSDVACVLSKQSFTSGRFYFEVQVTGKTQWYLGVVRDSINRKGQIKASPQSGYWVIGLIEGKHVTFASPFANLSLRSVPKRIGVFVDYENVLVSFHDVDIAAPIYIFTECNFTEKLLAFFCPGVSDGGNTDPLIISQVKS